VPGDRPRLQVRHDDHSLSGIAYFTTNVPCRPGQGRAISPHSDSEFTRWPEGLTTAVEQSGSHPQLAAARARELKTTLPNDAVGDRGRSLGMVRV